MDLKISRSDDGTGRVLTTVAPIGFVDLSNSAHLVDAGASVLGAGESLALDLSGVDFIDSTGISALVELATVAQRAGQGFELTATSTPVRRVLELTGLAERWSSS